MKYCPRCDTEYLDAAERCADCDVALVDEATYAASREREDWRARSQSGEMVMLCDVGDTVEADSILAALEQEAIVGYLHTYSETVYIGHTDLHQGFGEIWVPRAHLVRARVVLEELWCSPQE